MTVWSVVAPIWLDFQMDSSPIPTRTEKHLKPLETQKKEALDRPSFVAEIERLIRDKKLPLDQVANKLHISLTTVRRVCRTLRLGRYAKDATKRGPVSRSSQTPFGWVSEHGVLKKLPAEMRWVKMAMTMRAQGESYHSIARHFQERRVPTKNGGQWHARSIIQILAFNNQPPSVAGAKTKKKRQ